MCEKSYAGTYLILSLKWSDGKDHLVWWGPDNSGYTPCIDKAGRYTAKQVQDNPGYYDNENTTRAVSLYEVLEGFVGPIQRIVAATYRAPKKVYECHVCLGEIKMHRGHPVRCSQCRAYTCDICHDERRCVMAEESSGRFEAQEPGA